MRRCNSRDRHALFLYIIAKLHNAVRIATCTRPTYRSLIQIVLRDCTLYEEGNGTSRRVLMIRRAIGYWIFQPINRARLLHVPLYNNLQSSSEKC